MNRAMVVVAGMVVAMAVCTGCSTLGGNVGKQRVVERIPDKTPKWRGKSYWEKGKTLNYVGAVTGRSDMALGLREAKGEAEKKLAEQIRQKIRTEFGSAIEGQNVDGRTGTYVKDLIVKASENVQVSGAKQAETFVEKVEEKTVRGVKYVFNCFTLVQLDRADYLEARQSAMDGALAEARRARNDKAEASLQRAFEKLEGGE